MADQYKYDYEKKKWIKVSSSTPSRGETNRNGRSSTTGTNKSGSTTKTGSSGAKTTPSPAKSPSPSPSAPKTTPKTTSTTSSSPRTYSRGETSRGTTTSTPRYNTYNSKTGSYSYNSKNNATKYNTTKTVDRSKEQNVLDILQNGWNTWWDFVKKQSSEESKFSRGTMAVAGMHDLETIDTAARRQQVDEASYRRGAKDDMAFTKFQAGKDAQHSRLWYENLRKGIDAVEGLSPAEKRRVLKDAERTVKESERNYDLSRVRGGEFDALNDMTGKSWYEGRRMGQMAVYDSADDAMKQQLPEEMQAMGTTPIDIPAGYDNDEFGDDIYRYKFGEDLDGRALTAQERQAAKRRVELVSGVEDLDKVTNLLDLTYDPKYLEDMQKLNNGKETYQDVLESTSQYNGGDIDNDILVIRDYHEGHVKRSPDEVQRAANRIKAATGVDVLNAENLEAAFDQAVQTNEGLRDAVAQAVYSETGKLPNGLDFNLDEYMMYMNAYARQQNRADREWAEQAQFDDTIQQKYGEHMNAPTFESNSQPISLDRPPANEAEMLHEVIVGIDDPDVFDQLVAKNLDSSWGDDGYFGLSAEMEKYNASTITPEQRKMYNFLWNSGMQDEAVQYIKDIDWSVRKAIAGKTEEVSKQLSEGPVGGAAASLATILSGPARAAVVPFNTARMAGGEEIDQYDQTFNVGRANDTIRGNVGQNLDELLGGANIAGWNIGSGVYQGLMSVADNWMLYGLGANLGGAVMGGEAADTAMRTALENGRGDLNALRDAYAQWGIEGVTEKMGMDKLFGEVGNPLKYVVTNALAEAGEEVSSEVMSMIYDTAMYGNDSDLGRLRDELITKGYLKGDLNWQLIKQVAGQVRDAMFGGLIGGAGGAAPGAITTSVGDRSSGKYLQQNDAAESVLDFAQKILPEGDIRNMASNLLGQIKEGGKVANAELGRVFRELLANVDEHTRQILDGTMLRNVRDQLREMGVDDRRIAEAVNRIVAGDGSATPEDYMAVATNDAAHAVTKSLTDQVSYVSDLNKQVGEFAEKAVKPPKTKNAEQPTEETTEEAPAAETAENEFGDEEFSDDELDGEPMSETSVTSDGEEVSVVGAESVNADGELVFKVQTADGTEKTVKASDVTLGRNDSDAVILVRAAQEYGANAASMFNARTPGQDAEEYAVAFKKAVQYGADGMNKDTIASYDSVKALNPNQLGIAYEIGRAERNMRSELNHKSMVEKMTANGPVKVGNVDISGVKVSKLNQHQKRSIVAMRNMAELLGINIEFTESVANERGKYTTENGHWDPSTLTLMLDVHAGVEYKDDVKYAMMHTASHELTHFIFQFADAKVRDDYINFVLGSAVNGQKMTEEKLETEIERYLRMKGVKNRDDAIEEIVAEASVEALSKMTEEDIQNLAEENPRLARRIARKIYDWVSKMKAKIAKAFAGTEAKNDYAKMMNDQLDELAKKWNAALLNAVQNKNQIQRDARLEEAKRNDDGWIDDMTDADDVYEDEVGAQDSGEKTGRTKAFAESVEEMIAELDNDDHDSSEEPRRRWQPERFADTRRGRRAEHRAAIREKFESVRGAVVAPDVAEFMESDNYSAPDNGIFSEKYSLRETAEWAKNHQEQYPDDKSFEQNLALIQQFDRDVAADAVARYLVPHGRIPKTAKGPLRNNVEYVYTFDMDTKCERTYQFLAYRDAIQKRIGRQLKEDEARCLIEQMRAYGQMIPCTYCYVEGKRMKLAELYMKYLEKNGGSVMGREYSAEEVFDIVETARSVVAGYLDNRFNIEDNYSLDATLATDTFEGYRDFNMPISEEAAVQEICERYGVSDKAAKRVVSGFVAEWVYARRMDVPQNLVNTDVDFESAGIDEKVLSFHDLATKAAQGGAKAKGIENYEPYVDQLKNVSVEDKRYMVGMGGIRKHSSNDFQIQNVQDYMLFFMDLAADKRGGVSWTGHTYTKNLDYARIFAPTNDRINVSIAMYGDNASGIRPNTQEGVEWEELKQVRKQYKNVGAMAMVTNNDQLSFALNSDWIDMIIPFHASGMKRSLYYDVLAWTDYTSKQSERLYTKGQMIEKLRAKGIKVSSSAKAADVLKMFMENFDVKTVYNEKTGKRVAPHFFPGETEQHGVKIPGHNNDPQRYFELCEQYGTNPRFFGVKVQNAAGETIDVTQHPSYLKLIKETARTDSPQEPIVAEFDMDYVNKAMKTFRGYANLSEDSFGIVDEFINEYVGKKRKVGYLTERAQEYKSIREEMAAEEAEKRARQRTAMMESINENDPDTASESEFADDSDTKFSARNPQTETPEFQKWFKGSKVVNEDGSPKVMYHGTSSYGFDSFDTYGGRYGLMGMGSYFTDNAEVAEGYTKNGRGSNPGVYEVYLSVKNPIDMDAKAGSKLARAWEEYFNEYLLSDSKINGDMTNEQILRVVEEALRYDEGMTVSEVVELFDGFYRSQGFDGITHIGGGRFHAGNGVRHRVVIAFEPEQVKSATDNIGTFDPEDANIYHQLRDPDQVSDRELLANVMDSAAETQAELDFVRRYRKQIEQLDQKQRELEQVAQEIIQARKDKARKSDIAVLQEKSRILRKQLDRMDGKLLEFEAGKPLQAVVKRQRAELQEKARERTRKLVEEVRKKDAAYREKLLTGLRDRKNESFARQKYLAEVKAGTDKLREMVTTPTNKKHVPEILRKPMAEFLDAFDFASKRQLEGGEPTKADRRMADAYDAMRKAIERMQKHQSGIDTTGAEYFSGYLDLPNSYIEEFDNIMVKVRAAIEASGRISDTPIHQMKSEDLHELAKLLRILHSSINKMNKTLANAKYATADAAAEDSMADLDEVKMGKERIKLFGKMVDFIDWKNATPYYAFERFGRGGKAIFESLMNGWDKLAFNAQKLVDFTKSVYKPSEVAEWERDVKDVKLSSGETVRMSAAQLMSIYCLAKRAQAVGHLMGGGIRVADIDGKRGKTISQTDNYTLNEEDLEAMRNLLNDRQREVADKLQADMVERGANWGNEVSMKRFGYKMFTEPNYFPVESDKNNMQEKDEEVQENSLLRLLNMSATKDLTKNASNAIVIRSIFDVYTAHMSDMAKYNALGLQILDAMKWLNYVERTDEVDKNGEKTGKIKTRSVRKSLENAYGAEARRYIVSFIRNLNGDVEAGLEDGIFNRMTSNYKIAAVGANLRVGMLQITSMPRAATVIDPKYLMAGLAKWNARRGKTSKQAIEKVGIAKWKSMGFYDTNISRNLRQMIKHDETAIDKVREGSMKLAEWGDAWTMGVLYGAVESELLHTEKKLAPGTEAWDKRVNERMREIIYRTQVVDSTMTRSHLMRQKGAISGALAFMSEPTLTLNMLNDAIFKVRMDARQGKKWNPATAKTVAKVMAVTATVNVFAAIVEALFSALRDDDEFEKFSEKYMTALLGDYSDAETFGDRLSAFMSGSFGSKLNLLDNIPVVSDIIDAAKSGAADQMWQAFAGEIGEGYRAMMKVMREGGSLADYYRAVYKLMGGTSKAVGLPVSNAMRDVVSIYNTIVAEPMGWRRLQTYENTNSEAAAALLEAQIAGDDRKTAKVRERIAAYNMDQAKIAQALAKQAEEAYAMGRIDRSEAEAYMTGDGGKRSRQVKEALLETDYEIETGLEYGNMKADYISGVLSESDARKYLKEYDGLRDKKIDERIKQWQYEKSTGLSYGNMKQDYIDGELTDSEVKNYRMKYGGADEAAVETLLGEWQYEKDTGLLWEELKLDYADGVISESKLRDYLKVYGGQSEEEVDTTVLKYDYYTVYGTSEGYSKAWRIPHAYETGGDYGAYIDEAFQEYMYGGDKPSTWKQARGWLASSLAGYYKPRYLPIAGTPEGDILLEEILDVFVAAGWERDYQRQYIAEKWIED